MLLETFGEMERSGITPDAAGSAGPADPMAPKAPVTAAKAATK
jgi:hypothetical protein